MGNRYEKNQLLNEEGANGNNKFMPIHHENGFMVYDPYTAEAIDENELKDSVYNKRMKCMGEKGRYAPNIIGLPNNRVGVLIIQETYCYIFLLELN